MTFLTLSMQMSQRRALNYAIGFGVFMIIIMKIPFYFARINNYNREYL